MKTRREAIKTIVALLFSSQLKGLAYASSSLEYQKIGQLIKESFSDVKKLVLIYPKGSKANLTPVVEEFFKLTGIVVELQEGSLDEIASEVLLESKLVKKTKVFDLALPSTFTLPDLVEANVIENLSLYEKKYKNFEANSGLYTRGDRYNNKLYGMQTDGDTYLMFYNQSFLTDKTLQAEYASKYGKAIEVPKTWEELDQLIRFFHNPAKERLGGNLFRNQNYTIWEFWMRLHAKGILPFDEQMVPQIDSDLGIEALEELVKITEFLDPAVMKSGLFENFKLFAQGKSFCNLGWGGTQKYLNGPKSKIKGQLKIDLPPGGLFKGENFSVPYFNWGWNYVVSSHSKNKDLGYLFCLFATSSFISTQAVREVDGYFDPYRLEHYEDPVIKKIYSQEFLSAHKQGMQQSMPDLYLKGQGLYSSALKQAISMAVMKQVSPKLALQRVAKKWQQITDKIGRKNQINRWRELKNSYPAKLKKVYNI